MSGLGGKLPLAAPLPVARSQLSRGAILRPSSCRNMSGGLFQFARKDGRKVDVGLGCRVQIVGEAVLGDKRDDLDDFAVVEARNTDLREVSLADVSVLQRYLAGECDRGVRLGVTGPAVAILRDLLRAELRFVARNVCAERQ